jgi:hypothetical protein
MEAIRNLAYMVYGVLGLLLVAAIVVVAVPLLYVQAKWRVY